MCALGVLVSIPGIFETALIPELNGPHAFRNPPNSTTVRRLARPQTPVRSSPSRSTNSCTAAVSSLVVRENHKVKQCAAERKYYPKAASVFFDLGAVPPE